MLQDEVAGCQSVVQVYNIKLLTMVAQLSLGHNHSREDESCAKRRAGNHDS